MESLDDYNKRRREDHAAMQRAFSRHRKNGIACPKCGKELYDTASWTVMTSNPPTRSVECECGYSGYRVA